MDCVSGTSTTMISIEAYRAAIGSVNRKSRFRGKTLHSNGFDNALVLIVMMLLYCSMQLLLLH